MKTSYMRKTDWVYYVEHDMELRTRLCYGYHYIEGNTDAYVSVTHDTYRKTQRGNWVDDSGGISSTDLVAEHFPDLLPLVRWHLSGVTTGPMHYIANALHWWDICHGREQMSRWYSPDRPTQQPPDQAREILIRHIVYGALDSDGFYDPVQATRSQLENWLLNRQEALVACLRADCDALVLPENSS